jgi:hypothetical protein
MPKISTDPTGPAKVKRDDTPLAPSPEAIFSVSQDSIKPGKKTWQQMSAGEKGAKKTQLMKEGGIERFKTYKDSVSEDANKRVNDAFEKNANTRGMTVEQLRKENKKPNVGIDGVGSGENKKSARKSPCKGGTKTSCNN